MFDTYVVTVIRSPRRPEMISKISTGGSGSSGPAEILRVTSDINPTIGILKALSNLGTTPTGTCVRESSRIFFVEADSLAEAEKILRDELALRKAKEVADASR